MSKLVLATKNTHKAREISAILRRAPVMLATLADFPEIPDVEETGETLEDNALLKAASAANHTGWPAAADDSGLFVDFLGGAPGVRSARYAGPECVYEKNNRKLLAEMTGVPDAQRTARFECVVALVSGDKAPLFFKGVLRGRIAARPRGENGFGYDPLFLPQGMDVTLAEMEPEAKNTISHRFSAFRQLEQFLCAAGGAARE